MRSEGNTEQRPRTCHEVKEPNPYNNLFENAFCSIEVQIGAASATDGIGWNRSKMISNIAHRMPAARVILEV
jgi:hypothetical protein